MIRPSASSTITSYKSRAHNLIVNYGDHNGGCGILPFLSSSEPANVMYLYQRSRIVFYFDLRIAFRVSLVFSLLQL